MWVVVFSIIVIFTIGYDFKKNDVMKKGCRKAVIGFTLQAGCSLLLWLLGFDFKKENVQYDYSYYLGDNYL